MEGSSSDSSFVDEELWIGPVVVSDYASRWLKLNANVQATRGTTTSSHRKTFGGCGQTRTPVTKSYEDLSIASQNSSYHSPDTTMSKDSGVSFMEKVAEIIKEPESGNTTHVIAAIDTTRNHPNLTDNNVAKYNNTLHPSALHPVETTLVNDAVASDTSISVGDGDVDSQEVIVISDNEIDCDFSRYQGTQIRYEDITLEETNDGDVDDDETPEEDQLQHVASLESSTIFDDTLEDMNRFLKYGANYSVPDSTAHLPVQKQSVPKEVSEEQENSQPGLECFKIPENKPSCIPRKQFFVTPPRICYGNIISPVSNYINNNKMSANHATKNFFKTPEAPRRRKLPLLPRAPQAKNDRFKDVISPVGLYIKHSGTAPIVRKVRACRIPSCEFQSDEADDLSSDEKEKTKMQFHIPDCVYKPSTACFQKKAKEIKLPANIQALMPTVVSDMCIIKHESRQRRRCGSSATASKLDNDQDLTVNFSHIELGQEDVSFLNKKPYF